MADISGFGLEINLVASSTFPTGVKLTQFADDADPFDAPAIDIGDQTLGLNGDPVSWRKATVKKVTLAFLPNGPDDRNMEILFDANDISLGRPSANDDITMVATYPDGRRTVLSGGTIINGIPTNSVASAGRYKSKPYIFSFAKIVRS